MHGILGTGHRNVPQAFQGRSSRAYDVLARRVLRRVYRAVAADIAGSAAQGSRILDIGTGPGVLLVELAARRPDLHLTGADLSADMIAAATRNVAGSDIACVVADVSDLPFPDQSFDMVVSSLSLHHWDHPEAAVPELARVMRPNGRVVIYDLPFAPFDELTAAAEAASLFGVRPRRNRIGIGLPFLHYIRYELGAV
jgi:ubiquinone/menaquinone biosynthesis C-methylase UbiE